MVLQELFEIFSSENVLIKHNEDCLSVNRVQSVKLEKGTIKFENYFKPIPVPFKYFHFKCNLRGVESYWGSYTKKYHDHVPSSFAYKVAYIDNRFKKPIIVYRGENAANEFIEAILKDYKYCKKVMKDFKNSCFIEITVVGFVKNLLIRIMKELEIIFTYLENLEVQHIEVMTWIFNWLKKFL